MQGGASRGQHRDQSISPNSQNDSSHRNPTFMTHKPQRKQEDLQDREQELQDRQQELERCKAALLEASTANNGLQATPRPPTPFLSRIKSPFKGPSAGNLREIGPRPMACRQPRPSSASEPRCNTLKVSTYVYLKT